MPPTFKPKVLHTMLYYPCYWCTPIIADAKSNNTDVWPPSSRCTNIIFYNIDACMHAQVLRNEAGDETIELVVLREFFGNDLSKRQQAALIAQYITHELQCLQVTGV